MCHILHPPPTPPTLMDQTMKLENCILLSFQNKPLHYFMFLPAGLHFVIKNIKYIKFVMKMKVILEQSMQTYLIKEKNFEI